MFDTTPGDTQFATVGAFAMPYEADIVSSLLEAYEIPAFLMDYETIYVNWFYSNALGGVKVQVSKDDFHLASEIIKDAIENQNRMQGFSEGACPRCNSPKTTLVVCGRQWAVLTWMVAGIPLVWPWVRLKCSSCGNVWRDYPANRGEGA